MATREYKKMKKDSSKRVLSNALQYSKQMSKFICWIWALYRFGVLAAATFRPAAAIALASTLQNLDWIMLVNEGTYLINSLGEKYIFSDKFILRWIDKGGFKNVITKLSLMSDAIHTQDEQAEEDQIEIGTETKIEVEPESDGGEDDGDNNNG